MLTIIFFWRSLITLQWEIKKNATWQIMVKNCLYMKDVFFSFPKHKFFLLSYHFFVLKEC